MSALKEATRDAHATLEKRLAVKDRFADLASYRDHISRLWSFYVVAETQWADHLRPVLPDFSSRLKAPLLAHDIDVLGGVPVTLANVPDFKDSASVLGGFYVLEGATLGGRHQLPRALTLGLSPDHGASYLASYGPDVTAMWQNFGFTVNAHCHTPDSIGRAVTAAGLTFKAMGTVLCRGLE